MRREARYLLACLLASAALVGCARDPYQIAWDNDWQLALNALRAGDTDDALNRFGSLEATAPRAIDQATVRFARASTLDAIDRPAAAASELWALAHDAPRRDDRARAIYAIARLAEARGRLARAALIYQQLVRTYPDLMPGERSLAHLRRLFEARGARGVEAYLAWTYQRYPELARTPLGDNLLFYPAELAHRRFIATDDAAWAALAERLYLEIHTRHRTSGLWNDTWWALSLLYHRQGRFTDEIHALERLLRTREIVSIFGHDNHRYFWVGALRIARMQVLTLDAPRAAAHRYQWFLDTHPHSIWRDDVLFWQGCAWLRGAAPNRAEASFAAIREAWEDSKYLARVPLARADPTAEVCIPKDFVEGQW